MEVLEGRPLPEGALRRVKAFLAGAGLDWDEGIEYTCALEEDGEIVASGSLDGATVKCLAVSPDRRGEDLAARIITRVRREAFERGLSGLTLYTKPQNEALLRPLGFYPVVRGTDAILMESEREGLRRFLQGLERPQDAPRGPVGCAVMNANPFTNGHLYLVETALRACGCVHLFILSEERGALPFGQRLRLAREATAHLGGVYVHPTGPYLISAATFPAYFLKDRARVERARCDLDIRLFGEKIAPELGVSRRYVGSEPLSEITRFYNARLAEELPGYGVEVAEIARLETEGGVVSASRVRALAAAGEWARVRELTPECTYRYLKERGRG